MVGEGEGGLEIFVKFNKQGGQNKQGGVGISKNLLMSVMNEKRNKYLILMLNLKVSKQTRTEASKNKVISIKHINKLSKSK